MQRCRTKIQVKKTANLTMRIAHCAVVIQMERRIAPWLNATYCNDYDNGANAWYL